MSFILIRTILWTAALCVLAGASVVDLRRRIIPNEASAFVAVTGIALNLMARSGGAWTTVALSLLVFLALALAAQLTIVGGGDVKMIAAVSLLVPPQGLPALLLAIALSGGLLSLVYLGLRSWLQTMRPPGPSRHGPFDRFLRRERARILASRTVPYSLAIFGGVVAYVMSELSQCSSAISCLL
jgi:prepilin peptidase CpaA